jgi:hypothetical protein
MGVLISGKGRISNSSAGLFRPFSPSIHAPFMALAALLCSIGQTFLFACVRVSSLLFTGIAVSLAVRMLSERHVACYPDNVELAGTLSGCVVLGPTETLTWDT